MRALARTSASVTLAPKASQLFQPMGGVGAQAWKGRPGSVVPAAAETVAEGPAAPAAELAVTAARPAPATARTKLRRAGSSGKLSVGVFVRMTDVAVVRDGGDGTHSLRRTCWRAR